MNKRSAVRALLVALCVALGAASPGWADGQGDEWTGKPAPAFELADLAGNPLRLADFSGKKLVWLNFWGLRCGPCVRELPVLQKIYKTYKDRGLVIVAVNADGVDAEFLKNQLAQRDDLKAAGITFPVAPDAAFSVIDAYGLMGAPLNVLIDKKGVVRYRHEGYEDGDEAGYVKVLEKLLAE